MGSCRWALSDPRNCYPRSCKVSGVCVRPKYSGDTFRGGVRHSVSESDFQSYFISYDFLPKCVFFETQQKGKRRLLAGWFAGRVHKVAHFPSP